MRIALRSDLREYLEQQVKAGRYSDMNHAVNGAVELARDQETLTPQDVEELRREIRIGIDAADRGEISDYTAEQVMARGRRILARRKKPPVKASDKNGRGAKRR
jgi:putative addiction module CopG family antidote